MFHDGIGFSKFYNGIGGPEYIYSLLTSYTGEQKEEAGTILYENKAFPGGWIAMAPPLADGQVEFADGHSSDLSHMSEDISAFLMWSAEPKLANRKRIGLLGFSMLFVFAVMLYLTNRKLWRDVKGKK